MPTKPKAILLLASLTCIAVACSRKPASESGATRRDSTPPAAPPAPAVAAPDSTSGAPLRGTEWRLVALGDKAVTAEDSQRAARITLHADSRQVTGSGGCNRMFGVYELRGDALRFSGVGSTKMACKSGMDTESAFLSTLFRVARWRISAQQLELSDSSGVVLARLEAKAK